MVGAPSDEALRALVLLAVDDAPGVVDGEVILVLRAFSGVDGGNDVDLSEDSWSRFVLYFLLGLELLCFSWDGFYIHVDGLVGGGFSFRLGRSALPGLMWIAWSCLCFPRKRVRCDLQHREDGEEGVKD